MCVYYIPLHAYHFQVPLGVVQHNENRIDEMTKIMDHMHTYVPSVSQCNIVTLPNEDTFEDKKDVFHRILLGGDQLTVARARGSIAIRQDHDSSEQRLDGLLPIVEDWHAKQCLLKVVCLYNYFMWSHAILCYRLYGSNCIVKHLVMRRQPYFNSRFYLTILQH